MILRPPRSTRTDTLFPYTTLFRSGLSEAEIHLEAVVGIPWVEGKGEVGTDRPDRRVIAEAEAGGPLHLLGEIRTLVSVDLSGVDERHDPEIARSEARVVGKECVSTFRSRW